MRPTFLTAMHRAARMIRRANSAMYAAQVLASGNPRRMLRWGMRRLGFRLFSRVFR